MKLTIQKALLIAISVLFHVAIFAQNAPKNIYELYSITKGGCDFQEIVPSQQLYGQGGGVPSSWPEPNATASENLDSMLLKYREYLNRHPIEPASVRKLENGNELFPEGNLWGLRGSTEMFYKNLNSNILSRLMINCVYFMTAPANTWMD
jgi:hypothetical protein